MILGGVLVSKRTQACSVTSMWQGLSHKCTECTRPPACETHARAPIHIEAALAGWAPAHANKAGGFFWSAGRGDPTQ